MREVRRCRSAKSYQRHRPLRSKLKICAGVRCSITRIGPWQQGQRQSSGSFVESADGTRSTWASRARHCGKRLRAPAVGQESEVTNARETLRHDMLQEAAQELLVS